MDVKTISKDKRFVTIKQYCEISSLSYATVNHMCKTGQLNYITTESGLRRIDTQDQNADQQILLEKIEKTEKMVASLCKLFSVAQ